jgi:uncharacterized membrane protein
MLPKRYVPALFLALTLAAPPPAEAAMQFCNRTQTQIETAYGSHTQKGWTSEGWWRLDPGQCAKVDDQPLTERFYFYYAISLAPPVDNKPPMVWSGKYQLCVDLKAFRIEGESDCEARHYHTQGFEQIDIGAFTQDYTLDFREHAEGR